MLLRVVLSTKFVHGHEPLSGGIPDRGGRRIRHVPPSSLLRPFQPCLRCCSSFPPPTNFRRFVLLYVLDEKVVQSKKAFLGAAIRRTKELMWYIKQEEGRGGIPFSQQSRSFLHPGIHDSSLLPQSSAQLLVEVIPFRVLFVHNLVVEEFLFFRKFTGIFHFELGDFICP